VPSLFSALGEDSSPLSPFGYNGWVGVRPVGYITTGRLFGRAVLLVCDQVADVIRDFCYTSFCVMGSSYCELSPRVGSFGGVWKRILGKVHGPVIIVGHSHVC
jgi:hypothetical protein